MGSEMCIRDRNIIVSEKQEKNVPNEDESALPSLSFGPLIFIIIVIAARKK